MSELKKVNISNWTMYGALTVNLEVFEQIGLEGTNVFNIALGIVLDDGINSEDEELKYITIFTDIFEDTIEEAISHAVEHIGTCLFERFNNEYYLHLLNGENSSGSIDFIMGYDITPETDEITGYEKEITLH